MSFDFSFLTFLYGDEAGQMIVVWAPVMIFTSLNNTVTFWDSGSPTEGKMLVWIFESVFHFQYMPHLKLIKWPHVLVFIVHLLIKQHQWSRLSFWKVNIASLKIQTPLAFFIPKDPQAAAEKRRVRGLLLETKIRDKADMSVILAELILQSDARKPDLDQADQQDFIILLLWSLLSGVTPIWNTFNEQLFAN